MKSNGKLHDSNGLASDPVIPYSRAADKASQESKSDRKEVWVGKADLSGINADDLKADEYIYDGMRIGSHGVMRVAYDEKHKTFLLLAAKAPDILQGERDEHGIIKANDDLIKRCYIVSAYRVSEEQSAQLDQEKADLGYNTKITVPKGIAKKFHGDWVEYAAELSERNQKHFTLYHAKASDLPQELNDVINTDTETEIFTNGRFFYTLDKNKNGYYDVKYYAPTQRKHGSFVTVPLGKSKNLKDHFNKASRAICKNVCYAEARDKVASHWAQTASKLWDHRKDFYEGSRMQAQKVFNDIMTFIPNKKGSITRALLVGVTTSTIFGGADKGAYAAGITFTLEHLLGAESLQEIEKRWGKLFRAKLRNNIRKYGFEEDCSDYYKFHTNSHISRLCAKINPEKVESGALRMLTLEENNMQQDHDLPEPGMRPLDIRGLITCADQRGFSSIASFPDRFTQVNMYQNGLVILQNTLPDKPKLFLAGYFKDLAHHNPSQDLPECYQEQLDGGFMRIEYDKTAMRFNDAFKDISIYKSAKDVLNELVEDRLFQYDASVDIALKQESIDFIQDIFGKSTIPFDYMQELAPENRKYIGRHNVKPPRTKVLVDDECHI